VVKKGVLLVCLFRHGVCDNKDSVSNRKKTVFIHDIDQDGKRTNEPTTHTYSS
jgi:hypothetical protein